jgi:hypothetical protein
MGFRRFRSVAGVRNSSPSAVESLNLEEIPELNRRFAEEDSSTEEKFSCYIGALSGKSP